MGSYLSEPVVDKVSMDEFNDKLACGASSMQGWRVNQEDSHNSILDYDENTAFFAVYDGHGGHEVAQYCSTHLPQYIKATEAYKNGDIEQALIQGFLGFDATMTTKEVVDMLKEIAGDTQAEEESEEKENVKDLYEEASMPIEQVIEKYTKLVNPLLKNIKKGTELHKSPMLTAVAPASSSSGDSDIKPSDLQEAGSSSAGTETHKETPEVNGEAEGKAVKEKEDLKTPSNGSIPTIVVTAASSSEAKEGVELEDKEEKKITQNGDAAIEESTENVSSSVDVGLVGGKSPMKKKVKSPVRSSPRKRNAVQLYKKLLDFGDSEEDDTEDDSTFIAENSSDEEGVNVSVEEGSEDEDSSDADDEDEEEEDEELDDEEHELEFARNIKEEPGSDSGCTAVVAILKGRDLYVANAGDSRCIVCRNGKAVEMSLDHKPEDVPERERITKAGGKVTGDGRVNGGLNLSRALGDHAYKQNTTLDDKEQMITALPDVKKLTINPAEDEFMVLACDGIWNFMSSQQVVDFVKPRLEENADKISHICEEMFDHCLAPNTMGDGTGCDNMTAIIVKFQPSLNKRPISPQPEELSESKRAKTEDS